FNGSTWVNVGSAGFSAGITGNNSIAIDGNGTPYVAYYDGSNAKVTSMKFNGSTWVNVGSPGFSAGSAMYIEIALDGNGVAYVVYMDYGNEYKATVMKAN